MTIESKPPAILSLPMTPPVCDNLTDHHKIELPMSVPLGRAASITYYGHYCTKIPDEYRMDRVSQMLVTKGPYYLNFSHSKISPKGKHNATITRSSPACKFYKLKLKHSSYHHCIYICNGSKLC